MVWYIVLFLIVGVSALFIHHYQDSKITTGIEIFVLILLILFSGTRYRLGGYDYAVYEDIFYTTPNLYQFGFVTNAYKTEIGYLFLNSLVKTIGFNFYGFTLLHSCFFYLVFYLALKRYHLNFGYILIVFLYKLFIFNTFVSLRQSIVLVIFLFSLKYILEKKPIRYYAFILPCLWIHSSAMFLIPLYFLCHFRFTKKTLVLYAFIFFLLFLLNYTGVYVFNPMQILEQVFANNTTMLLKVDQYFTEEVGVNILNVIECYAIIIFLYFHFEQCYQTKEERLFVNLFLLLIPIVTFFRSFEIMVRLRDYFSISMAFVLSYIFKSYSKKDQLLFYFFTTLLCFAGFIRYIYQYDNGSLREYESYIPYQESIWEERE